MRSYCKKLISCLNFGLRFIVIPFKGLNNLMSLTQSPLIISNFILLFCNMNNVTNECPHKKENCHLYNKIHICNDKRVLCRIKKHKSDGYKTYNRGKKTYHKSSIPCKKSNCWNK